MRRVPHSHLIQLSEAGSPTSVLIGIPEVLTTAADESLCLGDSDIISGNHALDLLSSAGLLTLTVKPLCPFALHTLDCTPPHTHSLTLAVDRRW